jgi:hypothetical protein
MRRVREVRPGGTPGATGSSRALFQAGAAEAEASAAACGRGCAGPTAAAELRAPCARLTGQGSCEAHTCAGMLQPLVMSAVTKRPLQGPVKGSLGSAVGAMCTTRHVVSGIQGQREPGGRRTPLSPRERHGRQAAGARRCRKSAAAFHRLRGQGFFRTAGAASAREAAGRRGVGCGLGPGHICNSTDSRQSVAPRARGGTARRGGCMCCAHRGVTDPAAGGGGEFIVEGSATDQLEGAWERREQKNPRRRPHQRHGLQQAGQEPRARWARGSWPRRNRGPRGRAHKWPSTQAGSRLWAT